MAQIHELSPELTNQIAAGEVIERPASVVKELCENSIDAGSTRIRINFVNAGLQEISVQDNGSGIAKNEIELAFTRHATSKINTEKDLFNISTLGFRGEALASIAAVAHVEILTNSDNKAGVRAVFAGGKLKSKEDAASPQGTKITVRDLFYNTPARLKYLRSERTEIMKIVDIVDRLALGHPEVSFTLTNNNKPLLKTIGRNDLKLDVANIYGRRIAEDMLAIEAKSPDFKISGLISKPSQTRSTRNFISLLLNGRYVKNYQLTQSIIAGYGNKLRERRFPICVININLDPLLVDVNVHPTKQEVRLSKEKELERLLTQTISDALLANQQTESAFDNLLTSSKKATNIDQLKFNLNKNVVNTKRPVLFDPEIKEDSTKISDEVNEASAKFVNLDLPRSDDRYVITSTWGQNVITQTKLAPFGNKNNLQKQTVISSGDEVINSRMPKLDLLGQFEGYILAKNNEDLYLVDQLAARRRLAFDEIYQDLLQEKSPQQGLLEPLVLDFSNVDYLKIKDHLQELKNIGIYLEDFGQNSFILRTYPTWLHDNIENQIRSLIDTFLNLTNLKIDKLRNEIAKLMAPKKVPSKQDMSALEAADLLKKLRLSSDPYQDSDGRVVIVHLSKNDINKMFKKNE